jgi:predicted kinase
MLLIARLEAREPGRIIRVFLVISGLPGTGKSAVARAVAERLDAVHLSIDPVENAMLAAGLEKGWTTGVAAYEAVREMAEGNLALGRSVVVDAVNDSEAARSTWRRAASSTGTAVTFVLLLVADTAEHRRRLEGRERGMADVGEPTWDQVRARAQAYEPWVGPCSVVDAGRPLDDVVEQVLAVAD